MLRKRFSRGLFASALAVLLSAMSVLLMPSCSKGGASSGSNQAGSQYVEAFTSGRISRFSQVFLLLSDDVSAERRSQVKAEDVMSISPSVDGRFSYADGHTVVFVPTNGLSPNTTYTVSAELGKLFGEGDSDADFSFQFSTMTPGISGSLASFDIDDQGNYLYTFDIVTADVEDANALPGIVEFSEQVNPKWDCVQGGRKHQLTVSVTPKSTSRDFSVKVKENGLPGVKAAELASVRIPAKGERLTVCDVQYRPGEQKYIEISFSHLLDARQDMKGLATIVGNESQAVDIVRNKLRLYPDAGTSGDVEVNLSSAIKSKEGSTLGTDASYTVSVVSTQPSVKFVGDGAIVPLDGAAKIPFSAIYMRGVRVRVFRIFQSNMGVMLRQNQLDEQYIDDLTSLARPVAVKTIFLDEHGADLTKWNTFAIDLSEMCKAEPGAMYRVELYLDGRLSAWPGCDVPAATKEEMKAADQLCMADLNKRFDDGWYSSYGDYDWDDYRWSEADDPTRPSYYANKMARRNVLATNIGLTAMGAGDGALSVVALGLTDAKPMAGVEVTAYNKQGQAVGKGKTNADGAVSIAADDQHGKPFYVIGRSGDDYSYLRVSSGSQISTSTFDVWGEQVQDGLKGFIYGDRGVWRPGDTLHIGFMVADRNKVLPEGHPVVLEVSNPNGQLVRKITRNDGKKGVYAFNVPLEASAPTGVWNATVRVGGASFSKRLRIETVKPNRLKINLDIPTVFSKGRAGNATMHTEWMTGGETHNLRYEISASYRSTKTTWDAYKGYVFDDPTKDVVVDYEQMAQGTTDGSGNANVSLSSRIGEESPGMMRCELTTHVYEPTGEFSTDVSTLLYSPFSRYVGIKSPQEGRTALATGKSHTFELVSVGPDGKTSSSANLDIEVWKVDWYWWWNAPSGSSKASFLSDSSRKPYLTKRVSTSGGKGSFSMSVKDNEWGTYLITATDKMSGHSTGLMAYFDWESVDGVRSQGGRDAATILSVKTDKEHYQPGDNMVVTMPSSAGSRAIVSICNGSRILSQKYVECSAGQTSVQMQVTDEMLPNAYVCASLVQPYSQTVNDMPIRLFGVAAVEVTSPNGVLTPSIAVKDEVRSETVCDVTVSEKNGRPMAYTLAIVDEGLLDLTHFKTPNAWNTFNAREALGISVWDIYSMVSGAYGGTIEQLFSVGGDENLTIGPKSMVNRFTPMVYFAGPFEIGKGDKKTHKVSIPNYNGRVRVMVVAGDGSAYGSADKSVFVTKPLMLLGTMPRQLGAGEETTVSATILAGKDGLGQVKTAISCKGGAEVVGESTKTVTLNSKGDKSVSFRIKGGKDASKAIISLVASGGGESANYTTELTIRNVSQRITATETASVQPGSEFKKSFSLNRPGDQMSVEVAGLEPLNMAARMKTLLAYPHGCAEQITSKAFPQVLLPKFTDLTAEQKKTAEDNVKYVIEKLPTYQTMNGGIGYWPGNTYANEWVSGYVYLFLCEAEANGYYVPAEMSKRLRSYLKNSVQQWRADRSSDSYSVAWGLMALAASGNSELGTMNRMKEASDKLSNNTKALLAAAYGYAGRKDIANKLLSAAVNPDYDFALLAATLSDGNAQQYAKFSRERLLSDRWLSTLDISVALVAQSKYFEKNKAANEMSFSAEIGKEVDTKVSTDKMMWSADIENAGGAQTYPVKIKNSGKGVLDVKVTTSVVSEQDEVSSVSNGLEVTVTNVKLDEATGKFVPISDLSTLKAGEVFTELVIVRNATERVLENIAITDIVPSGVEILKTSAEQLGVLTESPSYVDVRDDRVMFYADRIDPRYKVGLILYLSATYPGVYYKPAVTAEAMYDGTTMGCSNSGNMTIEP